MEQAPPPAQTLDPTIPKPIERGDRAVSGARSRAARYQTSAELVAALDRLDENGELIPIKRVVRLPVRRSRRSPLLLAVSVGVWWYQRQFIPPPMHDPVSVVIADFQNTTSDPNFDSTLEQTLSAGWRKRELHHRLRPDENPAGVRRAATREARRNRRAPARHQARAWARRRRRRSPLSGSWLRHLGPGDTAADRECRRPFTRRASSKDQVLDAVTRVVARCAGRSVTKHRIRISCLE